MNKTIETLKNEAKQSQAFNAVCHVFALRRRTRFTLSINSLTQKMKNEGFDFSRKEYENVFKALHNAGLGELVKNKNGRLVGMKNIKNTLQSIGKAACGEQTTFITAQKPVKAIPIDLPSIHPKTIIERRVNHDLGLIVHVDGKPITLQLPKDLDVKDLSKLILKLRTA